MEVIFRINVLWAVMAALGIFFCSGASAQKFIHPGLNQTAKDLDNAKRLVLKGEEPYAAVNSKFENNRLYPQPE